MKGLVIFRGTHIGNLPGLLNAIQEARANLWKNANLGVRDFYSFARWKVIRWPR